MAASKTSESSASAHPSCFGASGDDDPAWDQGARSTGARRGADTKLQSEQSEPSSQAKDCAPARPSSQAPSEHLEHLECGAEE
eukprot:1309818-Prymnesium_polylepis.1